MSNTKPFLTEDDKSVNNVILQKLVTRIKQRAYLDSDESIGEWIEDYHIDKANVKIAELEAWSKKQNDFIDKLGQENQKLREERDEFAIGYAIYLNEYVFPLSTYEKLLEQFKQQSK